MSQIYLAEDTLGRQEIKSTKIKSNQMLVFGERGKPEYPGKTSHSRVENQQTQTTFEAECGNRTLATLVEGKCSHHKANPAVGKCYFSRFLTCSVLPKF